MLAPIGVPLRHIRKCVSPLAISLTRTIEYRSFHSTKYLRKQEDEPSSTTSTTSTSTTSTTSTTPSPDAQKEIAFFKELLSSERKGEAPKGREEGEGDDKTFEATLVVEQAIEKDIIKKYQKRGDWDRTEVRKQISKALKGLDQPKIPGQQNQTYKVKDYTVSIEDVDEDVIEEKNKRADVEASLQSHTVREPPHEVVEVDNDPTLVDILLDKPSQADKRIASAKGEELLEFENLQELEEFEEGKGKPADKKITLSEHSFVSKSKRGPAIRKNEFGADNLTLLYDEQPPSNRAVVTFKDPLKKLKYLPIYPKKIREWVTYLRHCKGRYNKWGYWKNDPELQEREDELREQMKIQARKAGDSGILLMQEKRKRPTLPSDLEGHYRFGVQADELVGIHPKVKEMLSFKYANNHEIHGFRTKQLIKRWQERPDDHGTPQVQIACMTNRINYMTEHLRTYRKDNVARRQLRLLISKRQSLLTYLQKKNVPVYFQLVKELDIKDVSF